MNFFLFLELYAIFYCVVVVTVISILYFFEIKYKKYRFPLMRVGRTLNKIRGKKIVLLPFKILSTLFVIDWIILSVVFVIFVWGINTSVANSFMTFGLRELTCVFPVKVFVSVFLS